MCKCTPVYLLPLNVRVCTPVLFELSLGADMRFVRTGVVYYIHVYTLMMLRTQQAAATQQCRWGWPR